MPAIIHVRVTQTREVVVSANSLEDAIAIASSKFNGTDAPKKADGSDVWGHASCSVKETQLNAILD